MKDDTEGLELVSDEAFGQFYTADDLRALADQEAKQTNDAARYTGVSVSPLEERRRFIVSCTWATGAADLEVAVDQNIFNHGWEATRSLSVYNSSGEPSNKVLEPLQLKTDGSHPHGFHR